MMAENGNFVEPQGLQMRKRKRKNGDVFMMNKSSLNLSELASPSVESKKKKTMSRVASMASVLSSTPMAKAFKRSMSTVRLSGSPAPPQPQKLRPVSEFQPSTPNKFFSRSASTAKVLQHQNGQVQGTPESPVLKRSSLLRNSSTNLTPYKRPAPTPNKQRPTRYWSEQFAETSQTLTKQEIKLQEALYELSTGEEDLVQDLNLIRKIYAESMIRFKILNQAEADLVFGKLYPIIPLHNSLACALASLRDRSTGQIKPIGRVVSLWVNSLRSPYVDYCSNLIQTKAFIDYRRDTDKDFSDFLIRCIESPFSRKLDLWSYLDVPRSRLVKYPLLLRQVMKFSNATGEFAADMNNLSEAIERLENVIRDVDVSMAEGRAQFTISRLEWLDEGVEAKYGFIVANAKEEMISGTLRNNRGTKLECYLLDSVLILGRPSSRMSVVMSSASTASLSSYNSTSSLCSTTSTSSNHTAPNIRPTTKRLQVYRTPIPTSELVIDDLNPNPSLAGSFSGEVNNGSRHGSFKSAFSGSSQPGRNGFRVSFRNPSDGQAHTLFAPDEHSKRQWLAALNKASGHIDQPTLSAAMQTCETDSVAGTPTLGKRLYAHGGKVAKSSARVGLFQKNRRSPRIKASLSHTALESVRSGGAVKKFRSTASAKKLPFILDENSELLSSKLVKVVSASTSKLIPVPYKNETPPPPPPPRGLKRDTSNGSLVAAAVGRRIVKQQLNGVQSRASPSLRLSSRSRLPPPVPPRPNTTSVKKLAAPRTKSWGQLHEKNASYHGDENCGQQRRYVTRSAAAKTKAKSMSDLNEM